MGRFFFSEGEKELNPPSSLPGKKAPAMVNHGRRLAQRVGFEPT